MTFLAGGGALVAAVDDGMSGDKRGAKEGMSGVSEETAGCKDNGDQCGRRRMDRRGGRMGIRRDEMKGKSVERECETKEDGIRGT